MKYKGKSLTSRVFTSEELDKEVVRLVKFVPAWKQEKRNEYRFSGQLFPVI